MQISIPLGLSLMSQVSFKIDRPNRRWAHVLRPILVGVLLVILVEAQNTHVKPPALNKNRKDVVLPGWSNYIKSNSRTQMVLKQFKEDIQKSMGEKFDDFYAMRYRERKGKKNLLMEIEFWVHHEKGDQYLMMGVHGPLEDGTEPELRYVGYSYVE